MKVSQRKLGQVNLAAGTVSRLECDVIDVWDVEESVDEDSPTYTFRVAPRQLLVINSQRLWDDLDASPNSDDDEDRPEMVYRHITVEWFEHTGDLIGLGGRGEAVKVGKVGDLFGESAGIPGSISKGRECFIVDEELLLRRVRERIAWLREGNW